MTRPNVYLWRGQTYIGAQAVAAAAGVVPSTVISMLNKHGNLDRLGMGRGKHHTNRSGGQNRKPVARFGRKWPSLTALADEVGHSISTVTRWLVRGDDDRLLAALMAADARRAAAALKQAEAARVKAEAAA